MLRKLLKYDLKYVFRFLIIFYLIGLFFAGFTRIVFLFDSSIFVDIIGYISIGATISMILNILINSLTRSWVRFKHNFYGDESYLTHTLPVKKSTLYLSKLITGIISLIVSVLVILLMLFIVYYTKDNVRFFKYLLDSFINSFGGDYNIIIAVIILVFLEFMSILITGFTGTILGCKRNNFKTGFSILYSFILYLLTQTIVLCIILALSSMNADFGLLLRMNEFTNPIIKDAMVSLINICILVYGIINIILIGVGINLFKKGVNVD